MTFPRSMPRLLFSLFVAGFTFTLYAQKVGTQYQEAIRAAMGACNTAHDVCLKACMTTAGCNECESRWRACKAPLTPDIDAMAAAETSNAESVQSNVPHEVDGCSLPWFAGIATPNYSVQDPAGGWLGATGTQF